MGLAKYLTRWVDDPTTPGERVLFRMPNWTVIEHARDERRRKLYAVMRETREVVGAELLKEWRDEQAADADTTAVAKVPTAAEVLNEYDRLAILGAGIAKWTYCEPMLGADGEPLYAADGHLIPDRTKPIPVNRETIADLEENTQNWAGLTLVALVQSGFRPILPEVVRGDAGEIIDIRPGTDPDPLPFASRSTAPSAAPWTVTDGSTAHRPSTFSAAN